MLKIEHLSKSFKNKRILNDVSLSVERGKIALLLGSSGVGKSTLLRILVNLETQDSGSFYLDGKPLTHANIDHTVGMVFQLFNLFEHLTVERNITLALERVKKLSPEKAQLAASELLERYGLSEQKHMSAARLSGGQKQRLAIARTLAMQPTIICLDEPTSALDPVLTSSVANNIQELAQKGYMVLVASHDTALIEKLDCSIYLMRNGSIIESALSSALKDNPDRFPHIKNFIAGNV